MRRILILSVLILISVSLNAQGRTEYYRLQLKLNQQFSIDDFYYFGFDSETASFRNEFIELIADSDEIELLKKLGADFRIISNELVAEYLTEYYEYLKNPKYDESRLLENDFQLGTMNGYFTLGETYSEFDKLISKYFEYWVSTDTLGFSVNNQPIIAYKFGSMDDNNQVLITALHHAREPGGVSVVIYFLYDLLYRARNDDEQAKYLLDNRSIYVVPVVNPDGFLFNQTNNPYGGGMWRKNRKQVNDSTWGVDLNRNYGPYEYWNAPINGSSTNPADVTYRGSEPFSEKETQAIRDLVLNNNFKLCLNFHTYGNLLLYPFSALAKETDDSSTFRDLAWSMSSDNRYLSGLDKQTVNYSGRGVADDWMYWTDSSKLNKTFSFTPEVGKLSDNFWTTPDRILEQCRENLSMLYGFLWSAEVNWIVESYEMKDDNSNELTLKLKNIGLQKDLENLSLVSLNPLVKDFNIDILADVTYRDKQAIEATIKSTKPVSSGFPLPIEIVITEFGVSRRDTITVRLGQPGYISLFQDEELFGSWNMGKWNMERDENKSKFVLTDSPKSYYKDRDTNYFEMKEPIYLDFSYAELLYETKWELEANYDFGIVEVSIDSAKTWQKLDAPRMIFGPGTKESLIKPYETGYSGYSNRWEKVRIPLDKFIGQKILLRFGLLSDAAKNANGWSLDNIRIRIFVPGSDVFEYESELTIYPNPSSDNQTLNLNVDDDYEILSVTNCLGNRLNFQTDRINNLLNIHTNEAGIYFITIRTNNKIKVLKVIRI